MTVAGAVASAVVFVVAACSNDHEKRVTRVTQPLSFSSGGDDGYCASNPSPECWEGTPLPDKTLALTFDDGPGSQALVLSSYLRSQGIRATFFVNGHCFGTSVYDNGQCQQDASASPGDILGQLEADGHLVGNHTQDHLDLTSLDDGSILSQVSDTDAIIAPYVASGHFVFRAPFGSWSSHDYDVLQASAMSKYVGPVKWDIGGEMTSRYAADWDCWQNLDGYGVQTSQQCGDRYLNQIGDVGRGIVLMHDADYGNVDNHSLTSGMGNTIDMVKYIVPILQSQGYTFVRLDEVPDIATAFGGAPPPPPPPPPPPTGDGGTCGFDPTWQQTSYANTWWVEYTISGSIASAELDVVGGPKVTLSMMYDKWIGPTPQEIPAGTQVVVRATNTAGQSAQTQPFGYLVTTQPVTACGTGTGTDAGAPPPPPSSDAGGTTCFAATWSEGDGANEWWIEYAITPSSGTVTKAWLEVVGGATVNLSLSGPKWVGLADAAIPSGTSVVVHAQNNTGQSTQTKPFGYLTVLQPQTATCPN